MPEKDTTFQPEQRQFDETDELSRDQQQDNQALVNRMFEDWKQSAGSGSAKSTDSTEEVAFLEFPAPEGGQRPGQNRDNVEQREVGQGLDRAPDMKGVSDFSIARANFDQLDDDTKDALRNAGVDRISVVGTRDGGKAILVQLEQPKTIPMDASSGCRSFTIDKRFSLEIGSDKDGNISLKNIRGLKALLDGNPPVEATIQKIVMKPNGKDGKPEIEITGLVNGVERVQTLKINPDQLGAANESMKQLGKLIEVSATGAFGALPENVQEEVPNAEVPNFDNLPEVKKAREQDANFIKSALTVLGIIAGTVAVGKIGRSFLRRGRTGNADLPKETYEGSAGDAVEKTLKDADKLPDTKPKSETKGQSTIYPMDKVELKFKDKSLEIDAIEVVNGEVYLRSAKDGTRYSAKPWIDLLKENLTSRAAGADSGNPAAVKAKQMLEAFNATPEGKVALLQQLAKNYAETSKGLSSIPGTTTAPAETAPTLSRETRRTGGRGSTTGQAEVATGQADISGNRGGGYDVTSSRPGVAVGETAKPEELKTEEIARLRREILEDKATSAEEKVRALRALELAEKPGNVEAREVVRKANESRRRGGIEGAEGKAVGIGLVCLTLASWYAYHKMNQVQDTYIAPARVN